MHPQIKPYCTPQPLPCRFWIWAGVGFLWGSVLLYTLLGTLVLMYTHPPQPRPTGVQARLGACWLYRGLLLSPALLCVLCMPEQRSNCSLPAQPVQCRRRKGGRR